MPTSLGLVGIVDKGVYNSAATYVKGNFVYYDGSTWLCISSTSVTNVEPTELNSSTWKYLAKGFNVLPFEGATESADGTGGTVPTPHAGDQDKALFGDGSWRDIPNPETMEGATASTDGAEGLVPQALAGDQDKVLQGNGTWGKKLQIDVVIQNNQYGYIGANNTFIPFKSQADIDAAVSAAMVGNATAADVLSGKTFTNSSNSGVSGSMPARTNGTSATGSGIDGTGPWVYMPYGYYPEYSGNAGNSYIYMTAAQAVNACPKQEKTVTAGTSAASVTPDSGKLLSKVTYNPTPSQSKSCTPSTSAQTVTPDSGKLLSSVSVSAISTQTKSTKPTARSSTAATVTPDSGKYLTQVTVDTTAVPNSNSGDYTCGSNDGSPASNDMGATNSYKRVNATNVYNKGKSDGKTSLISGMTLISRKTSGTNTSTTVGINDLVVNGYYLIGVAITSGTATRFSITGATVLYYDKNSATSSTAKSYIAIVVKATRTYCDITFTDGTKGYFSMAFKFDNY